jgi:hypothetical protein
MSSENKNVSANERTALITAIGIMLGFALAFFTTWSLKETTPDIPVVLVAQDQSTAIKLKDDLAKELEGKGSKFPRWDVQDLFPLGGLFVGIIVLMVSLYRSLMPPDQTIGYYRSTIWIFMAGILVVLISSFAAVFV